MSICVRVLVLALTASFLLLLVGPLQGRNLMRTPTDDTFVDEYSPSSVNGAANYTIARRAGSGYALEILLDFDLGDLDNINVGTATLKLWYYHYNDGNPAGKTLEVYRTSAAWSEGTASWNNRPGRYLAPVATGTVPTATGSWMDIDVTTEVNNIVNGVGTYLGWYIIDPASSGFYNMIYFRTKEYGDSIPRLEIEYTCGGGDVINVPLDYSTIQQAINAADPCDTVLVSGGSFSGAMATGISVNMISAMVSTPANHLANEVWEVSSQTSGIIDPSEYTASSRPGILTITFDDISYNGDLVDVSYGMVSLYSEQLNVNVPIVLRGESPTSTIISGSSGPGVITVSSNDVAVENFGLMWVYDLSVNTSAVKASGRDRLLIRNNVIRMISSFQHASGVWLTNCGDCDIHNNTFYDIDCEQTAAAIWLDNCQGGTVCNNVAAQIYGYGSEYALRCTNGSSPSISHNCFHNCGYLGCSAGPGDIAVEPYLVFPNLHDLHLQSLHSSYHLGLWEIDDNHSPAIDAGDNTFACGQEPDPNGGCINMGAYGNTPEASKTFCDCVPGDADGNSLVNISDAVYLIAFIFGGGPNPTPYAVCSGDADANCLVNISDAVYLIAYIFGGGPAPVDCLAWMSACGPPGS